MSSEVVQGAYFGCSLDCYNLAGSEVEFVHAFAGENFRYSDAFNQYRNDGLPELSCFKSRSDMVEKVLSWPKLDVLIIAGFPYRLPIEVIEHFRWVINMHPGDLFSNRGATPIAVDLLQKNTFLTASVHLIDSERFDAGPFIAKATFPAHYNQNYAFNENLVCKYGGALLKSVLGRISAGFELGAVSWVPSDGSYIPRVSSDIFSQLVSAPSVQDFHDAQALIGTVV
jgi:methionyl-tRNA formyltransferase